MNISATAADHPMKIDDSLFRVAFETSDYGVIFLNSAQRVVFWNDWMAAKSKIEADMALGQSLLELFPEIAGKRISGAIIRAYSGASTILSSVLNKAPFPLYNRKDNGELYILLQSVSVRPFTSSEGETFCMLQINDMTAIIKRDALLKEYVEKAQGLSKLKSEFISTVSHELRTPLTSINGSLTLLSNGVVGNLEVDVKSLVDIALNNTSRLILLINDILDIEKIEAGRLDFSIGAVLLPKLISQSIECNKPYGDKFQVSYKMINPAGDVNVLADMDRLMQVMNNLLSNAAKFSQANSQVEIIISRRDEFIRVTVKDNGAGISEAFKERIFEKFSQADASDEREKGGTGLGLSICKHIMDRMSGKISYSNNPEGGASFHIDLKEIVS